MKKQFVTYPIALALKELDFNESCIALFVDETFTMGVRWSCRKDYTNMMFAQVITAPLWQQAIDWFEESYIYISIFKECVGSDEWEFVYRIEYLPKETWEEKRRALSFKRIDSFREGPSSYSGAWRTSHEAREAAILEAIKIVKGE